MSFLMFNRSLGAQLSSLNLNNYQLLTQRKRSVVIYRGAMLA